MPDPAVTPGADVDAVHARWSRLVDDHDPTPITAAEAVVLDDLARELADRLNPPATSGAMLAAYRVGHNAGRAAGWSDRTAPGNTPGPPAPAQHAVDDRGRCITESTITCTLTDPRYTSRPRVRSVADREADAALLGRPADPPTELDLIRAAHQLRRAMTSLGGRPNLQAIDDVAAWLAGELGAQGSDWGVRLPVAGVRRA